jgi:hypothetical protein
VGVCELAVRPYPRADRVAGNLTLRVAHLGLERATHVGSTVLNHLQEIGDELLFRSPPEIQETHEDLLPEENFHLLYHDARPDVGLGVAALQSVLGFRIQPALVVRQKLVDGLVERADLVQKSRERRWVWRAR